MNEDSNQALVPHSEQAIAGSGEFAAEGHTLASALAVLGGQMQATVDGMKPNDLLIEVDHCVTAHDRKLGFGSAPIGKLLLEH
jgi:hypothetical protein